MITMIQARHDVHALVVRRGDQILEICTTDLRDPDATADALVWCQAIADGRTHDEAEDAVQWHQIKRMAARHPSAQPLPPAAESGPVEPPVSDVAPADRWAPVAVWAVTAVISVTGWYGAYQALRWLGGWLG